MKTSRIRTRRLLFQKLYALTYNTSSESDFHNSFFEGVFNYEIDTEYLNSSYQLILDNELFFIRIIEKYAPKFNIKVMNPLSYLPIFIALNEMFFLKEEIPAKVSINETVEIAKAYWDDSSKKIVNGILNTVINNLEDITILSKENFDKSDFSFFKKTPN